MPGGWRKASFTAIFKKGKEEFPGNYRLVSYAWIPGKVMEQLTLESISRRVKGKKVSRQE